MLGEAKIKKILIENNYVSPEDITSAEIYAKSHKTSFLGFLFEEGILSQDILGQAVAEFYEVKYANLKDKKIEPEALTSIPEVVIRSRSIIPFEKDSNSLHIGMVDPEDYQIISLLKKRLGKDIIPYYITSEDFESALKLFRSELREEFETILAKIKETKTEREDKDDLMVALVSLVMKYGFENKASDIHIEPYEDKIVVRFRIDGIMNDVLEIPKEFLDHILTRIKVISGMRTDEHRAAQDGKFRYKVGKENIDVRVSILPITQGEKVVMRLLASNIREYSLTDLGLSNDNLEKVKHQIKNPHGMILVTGPTGSGKTTTLYAVLKILNKREINIATIEDPVEYDIEGVSQIQVNPKTNLTFAKGLRSIVRQDPDIIMVGEIRDEETAGIGVNSALTGHLVLSTLHTNDAATALPRLLDMKVEPFLVASTVNMVIAQRLVRKICPHCKQSYKPSETDIKSIQGHSKMFQLINKMEIDLSDTMFYKGVGCKSCGNSGYSGRLALFEILEMGEKIKELVLKNASSDEINTLAKNEGMESILEDGINKISSGQTTLEEVIRVTIG